MKKIESGFTLIELVVVMVLLGILAATALPKFIDLTDEANTAALDGVVGSMASAMAINYAGCSAKNHSAVNDECTAVDDCADIGSILTNGVPSGYQVDTTQDADLGASDGDTASCNVLQTATNNSANYQGIRAGNN